MHSNTFIDTHAHVAFEAYDEDREQTLTRAFELGVSKLLHPCCRLSEFKDILQLSQKYNGEGTIDIYAAIGIHPTDIQSWTDTTAVEIENLVNESLNQGYKLKAIGETGLDYYHCKKPEEQKQQREIFVEHIRIAQKYKLPLIVHTRDAWQDTVKILEQEYSQPEGSHGVIHCFTGELEHALKMIDLGFYISWSGVVTYKKNDNFREIAARLPLDRFLIETDSPFLAPQAHRGKRNEPAFVTSVAETLAQCYGKSLEEIAKLSTANAEKLFAF